MFHPTISPVPPGALIVSNSAIHAAPTDEEASTTPPNHRGHPHRTTPPPRPRAEGVSFTPTGTRRIATTEETENIMAKTAKLETSQRAYTMALREVTPGGLEALWHTHLLVNRGAAVFASWLLNF